MSKTKIAINGFGRIGRTFFRSAFDNEDIEVVAINDLGSLDNLAYLLKYDSVYGRSPFAVEVKEGKLIVDGKEISFTKEKEPGNLPWKQLEIDVVVESTGFFTNYKDAKKHLDAGAKRVVISAPAKGDPAEAGVESGTVLMGVNDEKLKTCQITSNASCTTNATSPLIAILKEAIGMEKAILNTVHAYTSTQSLIDSPNQKDLRRGRAAALNIIPAETGAAISTTKAHTELKGKFDGIALRVPVPVGSLVDVTFVASRKTSVEEVNNALKKAATNPKWSNLFTATNEPLVSSDIIGSSIGSIADLSSTRVVDGDLVKVFAWYDNETSYTATLLKHVIASSKHISNNNEK